MKKYASVLSLLVVMAGIILSCSKSSDPAASQAQQMIGNWKLASSSTTECTNTADNVPLETCTTSCPTLAITATTVTINDSGVSASFAYTVSGNTITTTPPSGDESVTFAVSGNTLTIYSKRSASASSEANCKFTQTFTRV